MASLGSCRKPAAKMTSTSEDAPTHSKVNRRARKPVEASSDSEEDEVSDRRNSMDSEG